MDEKSSQRAISSILFVCLGNICRSPLAEGIARKMAAERGLGLRIDSAGTANYHIGDAPDRRSIATARVHGADISRLKGRQLNCYDDFNFDLIIAMDEQNYRDILRMGFPRERVKMLGDFAHNGASVPDPYYGGEAEFEAVFCMLKRGIEAMFKVYFG